MNEHKVTGAFLMQKRGNEWARVEIPKPTDIQGESHPIHVMGHYAGEGQVKEIRLGLPKNVWTTK